MPDPKYKISNQSGYVLVEDPPDYDVVLNEQPAKLWAISAACYEADCWKVLIRGSKASVKLTNKQISARGEAVGNLNLHIAVVTSHDASQDQQELLENTASDLGSTIQFFDKEQDAKDWLDV